ncbi:hypothetical protein FNW02_04865 [Komarekiella sp. 'clone 1']|uniref:Uncharacterized protein n=2 Tax=Komarekiella TaxID=2022127 RepID=A0AA40STX5_9NOST|nr:hypothetical protein [Komarekiella delphini-convector]MBD6615199.1 hypothetical protein [Komarekiella delphini-convector SJRDD-AB1]
MKCINCGTDNNLKDRTANQGRCTKCQHPFVFEPTSMGNVKITDPMFAKAIADISTNNTLFFTPKQLYYLLDNRIKFKTASIFGYIFIYVLFNIFISLLIGEFTLALLGSYSSLIISLIVNICFIYYFYTKSKSSKINIKYRQKYAKSLQIIGCIILAIGIYNSLLTFNSFSLFLIVVIMGMLSIYLGTRQLSRSGLLTQEFLFSQSQFQDWLKRWQEINNSNLKLLPAPRAENTLTKVNPDVTAYSFDRLIVCDSAVIAQLLIANNFHFENNCAILGINGYPQSIFDTTMQMLRRNPDLQVYALHDCSPQGIGLVHRLRTSPKWFKDSDVVVIDIGLTPRQIIATKRGMFIQSSPDSAQAAKELAGEIRQGLSTEEIEFLELGKFVELESFTPQKLIQVLQRGIAGSSNLQGDDSNLILVGDPGNDMYAVQSFG